MKTNPVLLALLLPLIAFSACKTHTSKTAVVITPATPVQQTENLQEPVKAPVKKIHTYRFVVSFVSHGGGIDHKGYERVKDHLKARQSVIAVDEIAWGREGEIDLGFDLKELSAKEQEEFITQIKALLKDSDLVNYSENTASLNVRD